MGRGGRCVLDMVQGNGKRLLDGRLRETVAAAPVSSRPASRPEDRKYRKEREYADIRERADTREHYR
jgi:hypothetical protein